MLLIILLIAVSVILTVVSILGTVYFFYNKKVKLGLISLGALGVFILLIVLLSCLFAHNSSSIGDNDDEEIQYESKL